METVVNAPRMLTLPEVAEILRCQVRSLRKSGWLVRLQARKIGNKWLVPADAVNAVLTGVR